VVQPSGEVHAVVDLARLDGERRQPAALGDPRGRLVHPGEHRVVGRAESASAVVELRVVRRPPDGVDVRGLVHPQEDDVLGRVHRADDLDPRERQEAELGGQSHRELDADGGHRMPGAEVVGAEPVVPDDPYALAHVTLPTAHARGRVPP
jgi:hypothetical protein